MNNLDLNILFFTLLFLIYEIVHLFFYKRFFILYKEYNELEEQHNKDIKEGIKSIFDKTHLTYQMRIFSHLESIYLFFTIVGIIFSYQSLLFLILLSFSFIFDKENKISHFVSDKIVSALILFFISVLIYFYPQLNLTEFLFDFLYNLF